MRAAFEIIDSPTYLEEKLSDRLLKDKLDKIFPHITRTPDKKRFCELLRNPFYNGYVTGNTQKFNYYRCSNSTAWCSQRDKAYMKSVLDHNVSYSQEEVETIFQDMFKSFSFDEVTCQRMKQEQTKEICT